MTQGIDSPYISRDDESEEAQLAALRGGSGEDITYIDPDEVNDYNLSDFGSVPSEYR